MKIDEEKEKQKKEQPEKSGEVEKKKDEEKQEDAVPFQDSMRIRKLYRDSDFNEFIKEYIETDFSWEGPSGGSWEDWDVSSYVSNDAVIAQVAIRNIEDAANTAGIREKGSSTTRTLSMVAQSFLTINVLIDNNQKVEFFTNDTSNVDFSVIGYWE